VSLTPLIGGAATVTSWSVTPSLPPGLSLNSTSGVISGTPTAVTTAGTYTVSAEYQGGSTSTTLSIVVDAVAPAISYPEPSVTLAAGSRIPTLEPSNRGGAAVSWSVTPDLPSGLTLSPTTGGISGTPTAAAAPAAYTITAKNSGGSSTFDLTIVAGTLLLDLGHQQDVQLLRMTSTRVMSFDGAYHWNLWDYATGKEVASGFASCRPSGCTRQGPWTPQEGPFADIEGATLAVETSAGLEVYSSADGSLSTVITTPVTWWAVATDGSYICGGATTGLIMWSPGGAIIASRPGDYSNASVFAAPGQVQVAQGPAGADVIETVTLPSGASTASPTFQGQFNSWFLDGQRFLTTTGDTVRVYSSAAVQQDIAAVTSTQNLAGEGKWFWNVAPDGRSQLNVFKVGASSTPTATYPIAVLTSIVPSGRSIGLLDYGTGAGELIDLSGSSPAVTNFTTPVAYLVTYAAASPSQWVVGTNSGAILDGASLGGAPRYFGYGRAWSIAGSSQTLAIATGSGRVLYFDAGTLAQEGTIGFQATELALSSDGSVLAAAGDLQDAQYAPTVSLNVYSIPSGAQTFTWPHAVEDFTLSGSGTAVGQVIYDTANLTCVREVTAASGGAMLWSDSVSAGNPASAYTCERLPIRLSPDGTWVAVSSALPTTIGINQYPTTNLYHNGSLVSAVEGWVVGWLDESHVLVNNYSPPAATRGTYLNSTVYDTTGTKIADLSLPVEMQALQVVSTSSIYDSGANAIYSTTSGIATWTGSQSAGIGAVAGSNVVAVYGSQVIAVPH